MHAWTASKQKKLLSPKVHISGNLQLVLQYHLGDK